MTTETRLRLRPLRLPAGMTGSDVNDPRYKLTPGLYDAGEASDGHEALAAPEEARRVSTRDRSSRRSEGAEDDRAARHRRQPVSKIPKQLQMVIAQLAFSNSDMAFQGNHLFQGNFYGMNIYDISDPAKAALLTSMVCPGGQGDVSVYKNLLFMSVEMPNGRLDCGDAGISAGAAAASASSGTTTKAPDACRAEGPLPRRQNLRHLGHQEPQASGGGPDLPRLAHAHAGGGSERQGQRLYLRLREHRSSASRKNWRAVLAKRRTKIPNTALFRIDVIKVPVAAPQDAKIVSSPRVFIDPRPARSTASTTAAAMARMRRSPRKAGGHESVPRHHRLYGHRPRGRRVLRQRHSARY